MQIGVLGPLRVIRDGAELELGPLKQRSLLSALTLHANSSIPVDTIVDLVWGDRPPPAVVASVHSYVAALRRVLEPGRTARVRSAVLRTSAAGYQLSVPAGTLDADQFAQVAQTAQHFLADAEPLRVPAGATTAELEDLSKQLKTVLDGWRGQPYSELDHRPSVESARARLEDLRLAAIRDRARIETTLGRATGAAAELAPACRLHPLREDLWAQRAFALGLAGRQDDALQAIRTVRAALAAELGIEPSPLLRDLEMAILRQALQPDRPRTRVTPPVPEVEQHPVPGPRAGPVMVGRAAELEALRKLLVRGMTGVPQLALLVGEPGIGKTRLAEELAAHARGLGFGVLVGRCSSDEGAPPLWPWVSVLGPLAGEFPDAELPAPQRLLETSSLGTSMDRFGLFDAVAGGLVRVTRERPQLLIFDDLHWADASTLRLLGHVAETLDHGRLVVVATRRSHPAPAGVLAELGMTLARRHALRLDLTGLSVEHVGSMADGAGGDAQLDPATATALRERTGGNPFFLIELLRLMASRIGDPGQVPVPAAVGDVITARIAQLPADTRRMVQAAATLGRVIDPDLLSKLEGRSTDDVLDTLDSALAAGVLTVGSVGEIQFSHALVRDAVDAAGSPLQRQRRHAALARLLTERDASGPRLAEIAQHWQRAGPGYAAQAWRTGAAAAAYAAGVLAPEEAADLLTAALAAQLVDPTATTIDRYDLLLEHARVCRAAADSDRQQAATAEAIALARADGDVERLAAAAIAASEGALWSNRAEGEVDRTTIEALQQAARDLPGIDSPLRCRVFLALSRELYWAPGTAEREACAERGLAMARRLGDPRLQAWACHTLVTAMYRPATLDQRIALVEEAIACSRTAADPEGEAVGLFWRAVMAGEAGRIPVRRAAVREVQRLAETHRLRYLQVMTGAHETPWLALAGRFAEAAALLADTNRWATHASFPFRDEAIGAAQAWLELWQGRPEIPLAWFEAADAGSPTDLSTMVLLFLLRAGRAEAAAGHLQAKPIPLQDNVFAAALDLSIGAEAALVLHRPDLAAGIYPLLAPWAGRMAAGGSGAPLGPVDAFLALAAAAVGERELATAHARDAARLCASWELPLVQAWLDQLRHRFGF